MATIDVLTIIDPIGFVDNSLPLTTPIDNIPMVSTSLLNTNVRMIGETGSINYGQATWNLGINVRRGDTVRWWDTTVVQGTNEDMIIVGFKKYTDWDSVMGTALANTMGVGMAYIQSGFALDNLSNLKFAMNSFQNNYIEANVLNNAPIGKTVSYYLVVAKLDVSQVGTPILKGLYRFDPSITVIA
ncbi:MAG TPA: AidA/PixA family protein [Paludibacter sp.]|nr:AidA/PixA family protein [Paludibacter sp.]